MKNLTLDNIAAVCGGTIKGPEADRTKEVTAVTTDSRQVTAGCLFIPIVGERVDGHKFIPDVIKNGAFAVLSERILEGEEYEQVPYILVESSLTAIKDLAEFYLKGLNIPVVGITGSVGKTSTKEAVASVLKEKYRTLKTQGNFNNELGLPLTIFRLRNEDEIAVLEMGISHFGEMTRLAKIARPNTCVITNIGTAHLENLKDREGILRAKTEIFQYLKENGSIVLNGDDDKLSTIADYHGIRPLFFGLDRKYPVYADHLESRGLKGTLCRIHVGEDFFDTCIPVPGRHMVSNALCAAAVGTLYGLTLEEIKRGIESMETIRGRFKMMETPKYLLVDDCYNASPTSMKASLEILKDAQGRKVAILGDMGELGEKEADLHREVGAYAAQSGVDVCICIGKLAKYMAEEARKTNPALPVIYKESIADFLKEAEEILKQGDSVLIKASHFMKFEQIVDALAK